VGNSPRSREPPQGESDRVDTRRQEAAKHAVTEYVRVLEEWFNRGGADYANLDPDKLDM